MDKRFQGQTVVCIASGPSLTQDQVDVVEEQKHPVIAVNDNYKLAPFCDILFACDVLWWYEHYYEAVKVCDKAEFWTIYENGTAFENHRKGDYPKKIHEVGYYRMNGLGTEEKVHHGGNSGYVAINLAYLMGASKIVLIGYDHKHTYGKRHWFGDHDSKKFKTNAEDTDRWLRNFKVLSDDLRHEGVDLVNCSIETAIDSCRRGKLEEELK